MTTKTITAYKSLRALFRTRKRWCKGWFGIQSTGRWSIPTDTNFNKCTSFCLIGGLCLVRKISSDTARAILNELTKKEYNVSDAADWNNDIATHADILKFVRKYKL